MRHTAAQLSLQVNLYPNINYRLNKKLYYYKLYCYTQKLEHWRDKVLYPIFLTDPRNDEPSSACLIEPIACPLAQNWSIHWSNTVYLLFKTRLIGFEELSISFTSGPFALSNPRLPMTVARVYPVWVSSPKLSQQCVCYLKTVCVCVDPA